MRMRLNMDIAELFGNAFRDIFANSFFTDCYQEHELANADNFEGKLKYLFSISNSMQ